MYAEDPIRGFLPSTGTLSRCVHVALSSTCGTVASTRSYTALTPQPLPLPHPRYSEPPKEPSGFIGVGVAEEGEGAGVRVDAGVREGSAISMFYDPMICKLVRRRACRACLA